MKNKGMSMKRFWAFFLSLAMIVTYVPSISHVYGTENDQVVQEQQVELDESNAQTDEQNEETDAVKTEKTEPSADKATATETETEYFFESDEVTVKVVTDEEAFAEEVRLVVETLEEESDAFKDAEEALATSEQSYDGILAYDIHFESVATGKEIEPQGNTFVELMANKDGLGTVAAKDIDTESIQMSHIVDNKAEVVADTADKVDGSVDVKLAGKGIESINTSFEVDHFSTFVITWTNEDGAEQQATIHYVTPKEDGSGYDELSEPVLVDTSEATGSISLNNEFDGYSCYGAIYKESEDATESFNIDLQLFKTSNGWAMDKLISDGEDTIRKERTPIANGSEIYVYYGEHQSHPSSEGHEDVHGPTTVKTVTRNDDGTSTIRLDVTAPVQHTEQVVGANVIVILDTTRSMSYDMSSNDRNVPRERMRITAARAALNVLVDTLNMDENQINFALAEFNLNGTTHTWGQGQWTNDPDTILSYVNGRTGGGGYQLDYTTATSGTNWEIGLRQGQGLLSQAESDADMKKNKTYVIFVTDGEPNRWVGYPSGPGYNNDYSHTVEAVEAAQDEAVNIAGRSSFYGVFCGNDAGADLLETLVTVAGGKENINARSEEQIKNAFEGIAKTIKTDIGSSNVVVDDGVTQLSSVSAQVSGNAGGFRYYKNDETWNGAPSASFSDDNGVTWDLSSVETLDGETTYSVEFDVWPSQEAYDAIANLDNGTIQIKDLSEKDKEQYVVDIPGNGSYEYEKGKGWTKDGSTYITDEELQALISPNTEYNIKTNTHLYTSYSYLGNQYTDTFDKGHNKMELSAEEMVIRKDFADNINPVQSHEAVRLYLLRDGEYYQNNGTTSTSKENAYSIDLPTASGNWFDNVYVAPGYMQEEEVDGQSVITVLETGHDYSLEEEVISGKDYEYEFTPQTVRPMVINRTLTYLTLEDKYNKAPDGAKEYTIDGKKYYVSGTSEGELVGTNRKTGELDITKYIDGSLSDKSPDQLNNESFTYRVTLSVPDTGDPTGIVGYEYVVRETSNAYYLYGYHDYGSDQDIPVTGFDNDVSRFGNLKYRAWNTLLWQWFVETEQQGSSTVVKRDENGNFIWKVPADEKGYHSVTVDMTLKQLEVLRFTNLPLGTKYKIQEIYANEYPADNVGGETAGRQPIDKKSTINEQGYTISQVRSTNGEVSDTEIANDTVSGVIEDPNVRYYNQFTNKLSATSAELKVKKVTENYTLADDDSLTFTLAAGEATYEDGTTGTSPMPNESTIEIKGSTTDLTNTFGKIKYTNAGTYQYTITEEKAGETVDGVTHGQAKEITVTVELEEGVLTVTDISATDPATGTFDDETGTFTVDYDNTYDATGTTTLSGTKTLENRKFKKGDAWTFTVKCDDADAPMPEKTSVTIEPEEGETAQVDFGNVNYTVADVGKSYTYTVTETGMVAGIINDSEKTVTVTITDNGDGTLKVEKDPSGTASFEFTNIYDASGSYPLKATKVITGREFQSGDEFTFKLEAVTEDAPMPDEDTVTIRPTSGYSADVEFDAIQFGIEDAGKEYTYKVTEVAPSGETNGITYDTSEYTVKLSIEDDSQGILTVTPVFLKDGSEVDALTFTNDYEAKGEVTFEGTKSIVGRAMTENDEFTFEVKEGDDVVGEAKNDKDGKINYPKISYVYNKDQNDLGEHTYTITETSKDADGIVVDTQTYTVTVNVTDHGDGKLTVEPSENSKSLDFVNTYKAEGNIVLHAKKILEGKSLEELSDDEMFTFNLLDEDGKVIDTAQCDKNGDVTFKKLTYQIDGDEINDVGKHKYKIVEVIEEREDYVFDETQADVTVTVSDNGDGTLKVTSNATEDDPVTFTNKYTGKDIPVTDDPPVRKIVEGTDAPKNDVFKFKLKAIKTDADVEMPMPKGSKGKTKTISAKAGIEKEFGEIVFTKPGSYDYEITEVDTGIKGYKYDSTVYKLHYEITKEKNALQKKLTIYKNGEKVDISVFTFTNKYTKPDGPDTGDNINIFGWLALMVLGAIGAVVAITRKRREDK